MSQCLSCLLIIALLCLHKCHKKLRHITLFTDSSDINFIALYWTQRKLYLYRLLLYIPAMLSVEQATYMHATFGLSSLDVFHSSKGYRKYHLTELQLILTFLTLKMWKWRYILQTIKLQVPLSPPPCMNVEYKIFTPQVFSSVLIIAFTGL